MASKDKTWDAIEMVLKLLTKEFITIQKLKSFNIGLDTFGPKEFQKLEEDIPAKLHIRFDESIAPQWAVYDSPNPINTLRARFTVDALTLERKSLIIHELTHALCDKKKYQMNVGRSESMAYIVQCQYGLLLATKAGERLNDPDGKPNNDHVFDVGSRIAAKLFKGGVVEATDLTNMRWAVNQHDWYKGTVDNGVQYDGL